MKPAAYVRRRTARFMQDQGKRLTASAKRAETEDLAPGVRGVVRSRVNDAMLKVGRELTERSRATLNPATRVERAPATTTVAEPAEPAAPPPKPAKPPKVEKPPKPKKPTPGEGIAGALGGLARTLIPEDRAEDDPQKYRRDREVRFLEQEIEKALATGAPIIAGPFLGEVGFELLYWIPLLRWAVERYPELGPRLHVVSRGGTASWYAGITESYVDTLDLYGAEEFATRREKLKQREESPFDLEVLQRVLERLDLDDAAIMHPRIFYRTYYRNMRVDTRAYPRMVERAEDGAVSGLAASYRLLEKPGRGVLEGVLPDEPYVAVRFYFRPSFPDTPENSDAARRMIAALAQRTSVVLLNNRLELDDHSDFEVDADHSVVTIHEHMTPADNLAIQSIAVAHADAFYGTYGGLSYLAPHFGRPALGVLENPLEPQAWHFELAQEIFAAPGWGPLALLTTRDLPVVEALGGTDGH